MLVAALLVMAMQAFPAPPPLSAEALTGPNADIMCRMIGVDGVTRSLAFRLNGTRGYPTGGIPAFAATNATFQVAKDETGFFVASDELYDNVTFQRFSGRWKDQQLGRFNRSGNVLTRVRFFPTSENESAVVLERQTQPMMSAQAKFPYAGMCRETASAQAPLSAAPVDKDRRQ